MMGRDEGSVLLGVALIIVGAAMIRDGWRKFRRVV